MKNNDYSGILGYAKNAINNTPEVRDNPDFAEMIAAIQNNDSKAGIAMANKILQKNGLSVGQGLQRAFQFFGFDRK